MCGREAEVFPLGLGPGSRSLVWGRGVSLLARASEPKFVGVGPGGRAAGRPRRVPLPPGRAGRYQKLTIKLWFCRDLIASGHPATQEVCFCRVFVAQNWFFVFHRTWNFHESQRNKDKLLKNFMGRKNIGKPGENQWFSKIATGNAFPFFVEFFCFFLWFLRDHSNEDHVWTKNIGKPKENQWF